MTQLVAFVFDDPYKGDEARAAILRMAGEGLGELDESAVIVRKKDGKTRVTQDVDVTAKGQKIGHIAGLVGAAVTGVFPLIIASTLAGRVIGTLMDHGITDRFVKEMGKEILPGTSCLIILGRAEPAGGMIHFSGDMLSGTC